MSTEVERDEATRRQAAINEALANSDACWRMEQEVIVRQLGEWRSRAEYAERELSAALDLPPSIGPAEGEAKRIVETLRRERDEARAELKKSEDDFQSVFNSRDEVIKEREQYLEARNQYWFDLSRIAGVCNASDDEIPFKAVERLVKERDGLFQRVETLRELADRAAHEQGLAQRRMTEAQIPRDALAGRARRACQVLVAEIGADGPADVDSVAERAAAEIRDLRDKVADLLAAQEESEHSMHLRVRAGYDRTIADCWRAKVAEVEAERDEARAEVARLTAQLESITAENHARAQREARSLEDWASLRAERDAAVAKAAAYERDWYEAKSEFGTAAAKLRERVRMLQAEVEMLRGVGCRETKADEPESGPCGVCLKCAEERGAEWALDSVGWSREDDRRSIARRVCADVRKGSGR